MKINGKKQKFTNDTGPLVTIMSYNPILYKMENIKPIKERHQDVNKNNQIPEGILGGRRTTTKKSNSLLITK